MDLTKLVDYAILAPSGSNSQPWKFRIDKDLVEISPDYTRVRPVVDPQNRELFIALGAAAKNLMVAGENAGLLMTRQVVGEKIEIKVMGSGPAGQNNKLFEAIKKRRTSRGEFFDQMVEREKEKRLKAVAEENNQRMVLTNDAKHKEDLAKLVYEADLVWYKNKDLLAELEEWLKDDSELLKDGVPTGVLNLYKVATEIKYLFSGDSEVALKWAEADKERLLKAPMLALIVTYGDTVEDWVEAGEVYETLALETTAIGLGISFFNRPLELTGYRKKITKLMGIEGNVQLLVRIGYPVKKAKKPGRRPVHEVIA